VAVLITVAIVDDDILTTSHLDGKSLLWYLGVLGMVLAVLRGLIPKDHEPFIPKLALDAVVQHIHYKSDAWIGEEHTWKVRDEFCSLFEYKMVIFIRELLSIVLVPFILMYSLGSTSCSRDLVQFFQTFTEHKEGVGDMCSCANFDSGFEKHGCAEWGAVPNTGQSSLKSLHGKMERSFVDFSAHYPSYKPSEQGRAIKENLSRHMASSMNESTAWMGSALGNSWLSTSGPPSHLKLPCTLEQLSPQELQMLHQWFHESMLLDHPQHAKQPIDKADSEHVHW